MTQLTTKDAINRFGENEERVDKFVNSDEFYYTNEPIPREVESLPSLMTRLKERYLSAVYKNDWQTEIIYAVNDGVKKDGVVYLCAEPHVSGIFADDLTNGKWGIAQGVTPTELFSSIGATLIGFINSATGAVKRTVSSKLLGWVEVSDFGAIGNGTDETIKIQNALNSLTYGGIVYLQDGKTYEFSDLQIPIGVCIRGKTPYSSTLRTNKVSGDVITMNHASQLIEVKVVASVVKTSGSHINIIGNGVKIIAELGNYFIGITGGEIGGVLIVNPTIDVVCRDPVIAVGSGAIQMLNYSNANIKCLATGPNSGTQPDFGIRFQNGDTAFTSGSNVTKHGKALLVDTPAGLNCYALNLSNSYFDSAGVISGGSSVSSAEIVPAGNVFDVLCSNTWFGLSESKSGLHMAPSGAGQIDGVSLSGCQFTDNGDCGLIAVGANVKNWIVTGGHSGGNTNVGIRAAGGTSDFSITGHRSGNIAARGPNNIGIKIDAAASSNYLIANNNLLGNTTYALIDEGSGYNAQVYQNLGYNASNPPVGITIGASPWNYISGHAPEILNFMGGVISEIKIDGQIIQNQTATSIYVPPNSSIQVVYSSLPTLMKKTV